MSLYWILTVVPAFLISLVLVIGLVGFFVATFVGKIPFVSQYRLPIQIVSLLLILTGVFLQGGMTYKKDMEIEVAHLMRKIAELQTTSQKTNVEIVEKIVKDTEVIRTRGKTVIEYVDREVIKYNNKCELPDEVIDAHNMAVLLTEDKKEDK
jgi:flagellar motor component MotA